MNSIPFLSAGLLFINPILLLVFRQLDINFQKLRFWFMATTGVSWTFSLLFSLTKPESRLDLNWTVVSQFIPGQAFSLDWISIPLVLVLTAIPFFAALSQHFSPQQYVWLSGLAGVCILGVMADTVYTLLFFWTLIEGTWITFSILNLDQERDDGRLIIPFLFRLLGPLMLIYAGLIGLEDGTLASFSSFSSQAGPFLTIAGIFGFGTWLPIKKLIADEKLEGDLGLLLGILPSTVSFMLITRGAVLVDTNTIPPAFPYLAALVTLSMAILGFYTQKRWLSWKFWSLGFLSLIVGSFLLAAPAESLAWGLVYLLSGSTLFLLFNNKSRFVAALGFSLIGILPIPFFPAWIGAGLVSKGISGVVFIIAVGLLLGGYLSNNIQKVKEGEKIFKPVPMLYLLSPVVLSLTQILIAFESNLLDYSTGILTKPLSLWIPALLMVLLAALGERIPKPKISGDPLRNTLDIIHRAFLGTDRFLDRVIAILTTLFEGEGGLIWALLIGFLLLTLINLSGGG